MRTQHRGEKYLEVQALRNGDSVLMHLPDGRKISVEVDTELVSISVDFKDNYSTIPVYNGEGEWLAHLGPTREDTT